MSQRLVQHVNAYSKRYGMRLVPIPAGQKGPSIEKWNRPGGYIEDPEQATKYWLAHPNEGVGVVLAPSGLCSLDLDNVKVARQILSAFDVDVDALATSHPTVVGNPARFRILFAVPPGVTLGAHKLTWPRQDDPTKKMMLFEFRAGPVQDVLPPTIHPSTGKEYTWKTRPNGHFPELPESLRTLWQDWKNFESQAQAMCPWAPAPTPSARPKDSVIDAFNNSVTLEALLERNGYKRRGPKFLAPGSESGLPGVIVFDDGRCFSHHGNDALADGHAHDAFDVLRLLEHAGDFKQAVKAAAQELGLRRDSAVQQENSGTVARIRAKIAIPDAEVSIKLSKGSDMRPEPIRWLWDGWLAQGKFHLIAGAPGTGKTTLAMALAATVTTGGRWPDGTKAERGSVLIWSGEDDPSDTLLPRLLVCGADPSKVYFVGDVQADGNTRPFDPARDMEPLCAQAAQIGDVRMIILDPVVNAVSGDSHKNTEVRRDLQPVADLAARLGAAALGISHFSKGTAQRDPVERVTGSIAFGALPRVVMATAKKSEEDGTVTRLLVRAKSNIGPDGGGFTYELKQVPVPGFPGLHNSQVLWAGALAGEARELLEVAEAREEERSATDEAVDWLREVLADGPMKAGEVQKQARQAGIADKALRRARERLDIKPVRRGFAGAGVWWWSIDALDAIDAHSKREGTYAVGGHLCSPDAQGATDGGGHPRADPGRVDHVDDDLEAL